MDLNPYSGEVHLESSHPEFLLNKGQVRLTLKLVPGGNSGNGLGSQTDRGIVQAEMRTDGEKTWEVHGLVTKTAFGEVRGRVEGFEGGFFPVSHQY